MNERGRPPRGRRGDGGDRRGHGDGGRQGRPRRPPRGKRGDGHGERRGYGGDQRRDGAGRTHRRRGDAVVDAPRRAALDVLSAVRERDAYANLALPALLRERRITGRDAAFATELTYGTLRARGLLDAVIEAAADRAAADIDPPLLDVLRLGAYQLLRTRVDAHAAVDTSVELVRADLGQGPAGFVNAVLRRIARDDAATWVDRLTPVGDPVAALAFRHAHPRWIAQAFADSLGSAAAELGAALAADDTRPPVHLVARPGLMTAEELALVAGGEIGPYSPYAVHLAGGDPGEIEPVRQGLAGVQDEGSQLLTLALAEAPLQGLDAGRWLDLCAGPGGKAALLGSLAAIDGATVDAVEPASHRAELVRRATEALPVRVHVADGRTFAPTAHDGYDRVLVDAPCTGLGALRRRPEARWRRTPADVTELAALQRELLDAALRLVRPGGVVLYATCSPHLAETVGIVNRAARAHGIEQLDTRALFSGVPDLGPGPHVQLWPHRHGTDAMFCSALRRTS